MPEPTPSGEPGAQRPDELTLDHHRQARTGLAEAVYGPGKSPEQCAAAVAGLLAGDGEGPVILTRADDDQVKAALAAAPGAQTTPTGPGLQTLVWRAAPPREGAVPVLTAGTGDLPVAREAAAVLAGYGLDSPVVADVGVAGLHRVLAHRETLETADVVVVVAGMEGALASVAAGLTSAPVVAVPTSTGYGASFEGVTALLAMLSSCSPGVSVVGIDNGFGAACAAVRILGARQGAA
ncbi:nickel pincer cofactor biosynthesis protein LarB [Nocardioides marinquilinus]|uniref:Nickel pincer cofactor biosynthesis protein LarB n=1 Tax=Nocardioides marinquilinus TaxID=1210400 RepID=A0ABP9Q367_9ACTN